MSARFRWVSLTIHALCDNDIKTNQDVFDILNDAPEKIPDNLLVAYHKVYNRIRTLDPAQRAIAEQTIKWVLYAQRQLSVQELLAAVSVSDGSGFQPSPDDLKEILANFVILDIKSNTFRLAHASVHDFLTNLPEYDMRSCHMTILEKCLQTYTMSDLTSAGVLRHYSVCHWLTHFNCATSNHASADFYTWAATLSCTAVLAEFLLSEAAPYLKWVSDAEECPRSDFEVPGQDVSKFFLRLEAVRSDPPSPVFLVCAFGLLSPLLSWLGDTALDRYDWNAKNERGVTPLAVALDDSDIETGHHLLSFGADIEATDDCDATRGTLLHKAIGSGDLGVLEFLIRRGANLSARNLDKQTPLNLAAEQGDTAMVRSLLDAEAEVEARDIDGLTALLSSVRNGHFGVARLLLEKQADIRARDSQRGRTSLHWAAIRGNIDILKLFLDMRPRPNVNVTDYQHCTPIILALQYEQNEAASLFSSAGADLSLANKEEITPLQAALHVENEPCISDYRPASELMPAGYISRGAQASIEILQSSKLAPNVSIFFFPIVVSLKFSKLW